MSAAAPRRTTSSSPGRSSTTRARWPEGAAGIEGGPVGVHGAAPIGDEVLEGPVVARRVENEIGQSGGKIRGPPIPGIAPEIEEEHRRAGRVVDAGDALEP